MAKNTVKKKSKDEIRKMLMSKLSRYYGITYEEATYDQIYRATILSVKDILAAKRQVYREKNKKQQAKKVYYLCMEFLIGPSLRNNLMNIGVMEEYR